MHLYFVYEKYPPTSPPDFYGGAVGERSEFRKVLLPYPTGLFIAGWRFCSGSGIVPQANCGEEAMSSIMHTMRVLCLPGNLSESDYKKIWEDLYAVVEKDQRLQVESKDDVCILFVPDSMSEGLGSVIIVELEIDPQVHGLWKIEPTLGLKLRDALFTNPKLAGTGKIQSKVRRFNGVTGVSSRLVKTKTSLELRQDEPDQLGR